MFVGVFNAAIAFGALVGGRTAEALGIAPVMWVAGAMAGAALLVTVLPGPGRAGRAGQNGPQVSGRWDFVGAA